jgi:integrase
MSRVDADARLKYASVADATRRRYCKAVMRFHQWAARVGLRASTVAELDLALEAFLDHWFFSGGGLAGGRNALYGILLLHPEYEGAFPRSARALKGMARLLPSVSWPPLTWELAVVIATRVAGNVSLNAKERDAGLAVLVQFDAFLRTGEVLDLRAGDFAPPGDPRVGPQTATAALRIRSAKTGPNQFAELRSPGVIALVRLRAAGLSPAERIFPLPPASYRRVFKETVRALGLTAGYVPHSLRHGAATRALSCGVPLEEIMRRGRWASSKSVRTYLQQGQALLLANRVPLAVHRRGARLASSLTRAMIIARRNTLASG